MNVKSTEKEANEDGDRVCKDILGCTFKVSMQVMRQKRNTESATTWKLTFTFTVKMGTDQVAIKNFFNRVLDKVEKDGHGMDVVSRPNDNDIVIHDISDASSVVKMGNVFIILLPIFIGRLFNL